MITATRTALRTARVARTFTSSAPARASAGHGQEEHHDGAEANTNESFLTSTFITPVALIAAAVLVWDYLPSPPSTSGSPSLSPSASTADQPWLTRTLAKYTPGADVWKARNERHLELAVRAAEDRVLFQEAERPKVLRLRYPSSFEQASPNGIAVGSQADLTKLNVKKEGEF